jgi:hypothetical protein
MMTLVTYCSTCYTVYFLDDSHQQGIFGNGLTKLFRGGGGGGHQGHRDVIPKEKEWSSGPSGLQIRCGGGVNRGI